MKKIKIITLALCMAAAVSCNMQSSENGNGMQGKNEVIENIMARRSIRQYKSNPVKRETMDTIMLCGINAPSGMNKQSWEVRIVDNPATISKIKKLMVKDNPDAKPEAVTGCFRNAPTLVFIANDPSYDFSVIDCGLLSENIMLSAWSLGVGSVCLGSPIRFIKNSPEALEMLGFSEGYQPVICIGLGYANESPEAKPRDNSKVKYIDEQVKMKIISDKVQGDKRYISAATKGVCSSQIDLVLQGNVIVEVKYHGGCNGNLKGIGELVKGAKISDIKERLRGIPCGKKATSCPDQLAQLLEEIM